MNTDPNLPDDKLAEQLLHLTSSIEAGGLAILPHTNDALLRSIVEAAARIFNAAAASILLVNENEKVLEFKVAFGAANRDLVGMKIPMDKGIAGYVVMTGQPLMVSDVHQDARFNQDFAKSTGYVPRSILATPLMIGDHVIGVMEVLDKIDASSFGLQDMELLAMFADQAAIAIDLSQNIDLVDHALVMGLKRLVMTGGSPQPDELLVALDRMTEKHTSEEILALADLFNDISSLGEAERKVCIQVLKTFSEYRHSQHRNWG